MQQMLYFAYGSNMDYDRISTRLRGNIPIPEPYKLYGYKLTFDAESGTGWCNYCNIAPGLPDDYVEGLLYQITPYQFLILDNIERLYERQYFTVDANRLACVYVCVNSWLLGNRCKLDLDYFYLVLNAAKSYNFYHTVNVLEEYFAKTYTRLEVRRYNKYYL